MKKKKLKWKKWDVNKIMRRLQKDKSDAHTVHY